MSGGKTMAQQAFEQVASVQSEASQHWSKYRAMVMKLPVMVHREGLLAALHFVAARGDEGQRLVLTHLAQDEGRHSASELLRHLRGLKDQPLREATRRLQRRLGWYKRCVQGAQEVE